MTGMVSAVNSEALLRQAQMESIMNGLGVGQKQAAGSTGGGFNYQDLLNWGRGLFSGSGYNAEDYYDPSYDYGTGFGSSGFEGTGGI